MFPDEKSSSESIYGGYLTRVNSTDFVQINCICD